jgi:hypothetical protein
MYALHYKIIIRHTVPQGEVYINGSAVIVYGFPQNKPTIGFQMNLKYTSG